MPSLPRRSRSAGVSVGLFPTFSSTARAVSVTRPVSSPVSSRS
jgi:hypothetical protein